MSRPSSLRRFRAAHPPLLAAGWLVSPRRLRRVSYVRGRRRWCNGCNGRLANHLVAHACV
jgi:hypothetical protein